MPQNDLGLGALEEFAEFVSKMTLPKKQSEAILNRMKTESKDVCLAAKYSLTNNRGSFRSIKHIIVNKMSIVIILFLSNV